VETIEAGEPLRALDVLLVVDMFLGALPPQDWGAPCRHTRREVDVPESRRLRLVGADINLEIEGLPSELIDRLVALVDVGPTHGGAWEGHAFRLQFILGGRLMNSVFIDTGHLPPRPARRGTGERGQVEEPVAEANAR